MQTKTTNNNYYKFIVFPGNNQALIKNCLQKRGNWEELNEQQINETKGLQTANFVWSPTNFSVRIINHFENNRGITTKTGLVRSLGHYYRHNEAAVAAKYTVFESCSTSFVITAGQEDIEYTTFMQRFHEISKGIFVREHVPQKHCLENIWLFKPANLNQGRGIEIYRNLKDIFSFFASRQPHTYWVAQKYIEKPLLFKNRKFDIRVWVLVTNKTEIFIYRKAYMRTCSDEYNMFSPDNYIHLTNNCFQKFNKNYGQHEAGNTLPLETLFEYLNQTFPQFQCDFKSHIMQRIKDLIIDTILSVKKQMIQNKKDCFFEFFGYDFLIDEDLRTWLIECNVNPYLGVPNDFIKDLLPKMADHMMQVVVDPVFPPKIKPTDQANNDFELIYCESNSTFNNGIAKNIRSPFTQSLYPVLELAQQSNRVLHRIKNSQEKQQQTMKLFMSNTQQFQNQSMRQQNIIKEQRSTLNCSENKLDFTNTMGTSIKVHQSSFKNILENSGSNLLLLNDSRVVAEEEGEGSEVSPKQNKNNGKNTLNMVIQNSNNNILSQNNNQGINNSFIDNSSQRLLLSHHQQQYQQQQQNQKNGSGKAMFQELQKLIQSYPYCDLDPFYPYVRSILSRLMNWELLSEKEVHWATCSLKLALDSRIWNIFLDPSFISQLTRIIDSQNFPLPVQTVALEVILKLCSKDSENKKLVVSKSIIKSLIKIAITACVPQDCQKYDRELRRQAINCLITFGGIYNRKMYIPGETRENEIVRQILIQNGGLLTLLFISHSALDQEEQKLPKDFLQNLDIVDYEYQLSLIDLWKELFNINGSNNDNQAVGTNQMKGAEDNLRLRGAALDQTQYHDEIDEDFQEYIPITSLGEDYKSLLNQSNTLNKSSLLQILKPQASSTSTIFKNQFCTPKLLLNTSFNNSKNIRLTPQTTKASAAGVTPASNNNAAEHQKQKQQIYYIPNKNIMTFQEICDLIQDIIKERRQEQQKREMLEKEKKEQESKEMQKLDEEKQKQQQEKKLKLEEFFRRREEEQRKKRLEEKRREEHERELTLLEEEKKKKKFEELLKKREEFKRKEDIRRRMEDEHLREELIKKKQLEENLRIQFQLERSKIDEKVKQKKQEKFKKLKLLQTEFRKSCSPENRISVVDAGSRGEMQTNKANLNFLGSNNKGGNEAILGGGGQSGSGGDTTSTTSAYNPILVSNGQTTPQEIQLLYSCSTTTNNINCNANSSDTEHIQQIKELQMSSKTTPCRTSKQFFGVGVNPRQLQAKLQLEPLQQSTTAATATSESQHQKSRNNKALYNQHQQIPKASNTSSQIDMQGNQQQTYYQQQNKKIMQPIVKKIDETSIESSREHYNNQNQSSLLYFNHPTNLNHNSSLQNLKQIDPVSGESTVNANDTKQLIFKQKNNNILLIFKPLKNRNSSDLCGLNFDDNAISSNKEGSLNSTRKYSNPGQLKNIHNFTNNRFPSPNLNQKKIFNCNGGIIANLNNNNINLNNINNNRHNYLNKYIVDNANLKIGNQKLMVREALLQFSPYSPYANHSKYSNYKKKHIDLSRKQQKE